MPDLTLTFMNPRLLDDVSFHPCARFKRWEVRRMFGQYIKGTDGIEFWGSSFIAGPQGEILAQASSDKEEFIMATVDLRLQEDVRQNWPFFRDRRIDAFGELTKRAIEP